MANRARPLSPHLGVYKWQSNMLVSILHRATGIGLATVGALIFLWWLIAGASGADAYATFQAVIGSWLGLLILFGLTLAFFQHLLSGLRHLYMDTGAGYEPARSRALATATFIGSVTLSVLTWIVILLA